MDGIHKVIDAKDILTTARLAHKIWSHHYVPIIGREQVDYMLKKFQSTEAIREQIETGYEYYLLEANKKAVGYLGLVPGSPPRKLMISKIYVDSGTRGSGFGRALIDFAIQLCKERTLSHIWLTVNRHNSNTIAWYLKRGFQITEEVKQDIGNGYFMDDFVMELALDTAKV